MAGGTKGGAKVQKVQKEEPTEEPEEEQKVETKKGKKEAKSKGWSLLGGTAEIVPFLILAYFTYVGKHFYSNLYPTFAEFDENHNYVQKYSNRVPKGDSLTLKVYLKEGKSQPTIARDAVPTWTTTFTYDDEEFKPSKTESVANVSQTLLEGSKNLWLVARLLTKDGERFAADVHGGMIKYTKEKPVPTKYWMLKGDVCDEGREKTYGTKKQPMTARGIPMMQVRLVYDRTHYPRPWRYQDYYPNLFVDEFWMTDDQLIKFNTTGENSFGVDIHFDLMTAARWRFQHMMEQFSNKMQRFSETTLRRCLRCETCLQTRIRISSLPRWLCPSSIASSSTWH